MSQNGKLMPNLDQHTTKLLNLTVLQRIDPFVEEILITAAHVTFYEFNIDLSQWVCSFFLFLFLLFILPLSLSLSLNALSLQSRKDVEGSLFVVKRNTQPRFQFIVMNRRNTENLVENLLGDFEYEVQVPYLLYRNAAQEVNGIWFYNARECEEVANLFSRILNAYAKVPPKSKVSSTKSEFEELEAVPTMAVMDGPLEPSSSATSNVADVPDDPSFVNFFSSAVAIGSTSNAPITGQPYQSSATNSSSSVPTHAATPTVPTLQIPSLSASTPLIPPYDAPESISSSNRAAKLVKPSSFFVPSPSSAMMIPPVSSSSTPTAPPLHPTVNVQRPYGTPLLQPFPPPTPPPSLTPAPSPLPNHGLVISREKVRDALLVLVQDNQFIDMVYRVLLNTHQS
ncbi:mRNA-decapping enzyme-like protein isoform X1 [Abrus precatorius]|uniref:mRNA-decapping enzyme-like protein isoform X1 n=1 Tax=Abrus precatorius TaxID=3816 RepID=A0A8B8KBV8_ABRPR|nr:mRNA-decapping enzyme-like protein isoform X1 [Abrus precatorius]